MPDFGNPLSGLSLDRPLTKEELIRAVRFMIAAEIEAVEMYSRVAEVTKNEKVKKLILDITNEEKVHAGEFYKILDYLDPEEEKLCEKGMEEAEEKLKTAQSSLTAHLDRIATELEQDGALAMAMALALDRVSDRLERKEAAERFMDEIINRNDATKLKN